MNHEEYMREVLKVSDKSIKLGSSPFAAIIVKDGQIIAEGFNEVVPSNDPSAHGEMVAIRNACKKLNMFHLKGCTIYTTNEPCPMCRSICKWARLDKVVYVKPVSYAAEVGFPEDIGKGEEPEVIKLNGKIDKDVEANFQKWLNDPKHVMY